MSISPDECARDVLEVVPLIMRVIRTEMRSRRTSDLSVPQFRALAFLDRQPGASLSEVAEHVGLTLPSMSTLVDVLVTRKLIARQTSPIDRRRITLSLTTNGKAILESAREGAQTHLSELLSALPAAGRTTVAQAMQVLRPVFTLERETRLEKEH
jgi:MarR family transcriptional regulator for hemolysin